MDDAVGGERSAGTATRRRELDAITIGETLAAFVRADARDRYGVAAIGAESNVAVGMAQLGCRTRWSSRLGDDEVGHLVYDSIAGYGVEMAVEWDERWPTAVCVKEIGPERTRVRYYRSQSAARHLSFDDSMCAVGARWIHLTGVTPALSDSARDLVATILRGATSHRGRVSFDVNYRPVLWPDAATARVTLLDLARGADVIFIGDDEAHELFGSDDSSELAGQMLQREHQELVIKRGDREASVLTFAGEVREPAREAKVVDLVGAGDAFAAGYLAGACWEWEAPARLRLGHFLAARVLGVKGDLGPNLSPEERAELPSIRTPNPRERVQ